MHVKSKMPSQRVIFGFSLTSDQKNIVLHTIPYDTRENKKRYIAVYSFKRQRAKRELSFVK